MSERIGFSWSIQNFIHSFIFFSFQMHKSAYFKFFDRAAVVRCFLILFPENANCQMNADQVASPAHWAQLPQQFHQHLLYYLHRLRALLHQELPVLLHRPVFNAHLSMDFTLYQVFLLFFFKYKRRWIITDPSNTGVTTCIKFYYSCQGGLAFPQVYKIRSF